MAQTEKQRVIAELEKKLGFNFSGWENRLSGYIWDAAIEAAAMEAEKCNGVMPTSNIAAAIRELKGGE
jgi:hypothetical protein